MFLIKRATHPFHALEKNIFSEPSGVVQDLNRGPEISGIVRIVKDTR